LEKYHANYNWRFPRKQKAITEVVMFEFVTVKSNICHDNVPINGPSGILAPTHFVNVKLNVEHDRGKTQKIVPLQSKEIN